jgi:1-acyl-sn-glycerol-3-phosphate acyltransferase
MSKVRVVFWYAAAYLLLLFTYPVTLYPKYLNYKNKTERREAFAYLFMHRLSKLLFYATGSRIKVRGLENIPKDTSVLFVSNHQGHMDSIIIEGFINKPKGFISIKEYQKAFILRTWMKHMGCVFMDRGDVRQQLMCISEAIQHLKSGHSMVVFPEGKLNDGKETLSFQKGWLRMAVKSKVPIVPITINNSHKVLSYNGRRLRPSKVEVIVSKPINIEGIKKADETEFINNVRDIILQNLTA